MQNTQYKFVKGLAILFEFLVFRKRFLLSQSDLIPFSWSDAMDIVNQQSLILKCDYHSIQIRSLMVHIVNFEENTIMDEVFLPVLGCTKVGDGIYIYYFRSYYWDVGVKTSVHITTDNDPTVELLNLQKPPAKVTRKDLKSPFLLNGEPVNITWKLM